ncbi:hypothetical protein ACYOEI_20050 [Singulisphaera rosea]
MQGLLADVNVQGHLTYLKRLVEKQGLLEFLTELGISLANFPDLGLDAGMDDRTLWHYCQRHGWVLFTDNRNHENENPLDATILDSWHERPLPVLSLADKSKFENSANYATRVARDVAEPFVETFVHEVRNQPRI